MGAELNRGGSREDRCGEKEAGRLGGDEPGRKRPGPDLADGKRGRGANHGEENFAHLSERARCKRLF